jgi:hypothetical protein
MKLFPTIIFSASLLFGGMAVAQTEVDSAAQINKSVAVTESKPDTLVDLNKQLGGIIDVTVAKGTILPEAIEITPAGLIILKSEGLLKADVYNFEVKASSPENEVYIITVKIRRDGEKLTTTIVSDKIDMATGFRKEGKIYVVVTISLVLFVVLVTYLALLDRRLRKLNAKLENQSLN